MAFGPCSAMMALIRSAMSVVASFHVEATNPPEVRRCGSLSRDGSCKDGRMGSGCCTFGGKDEGKCARVGREDEGVSSNRPELGAVVLALQSVGLNEDALLLCDNEAVLCVIRKWVGQGGKATLATAPDADILREIICLLTQRVRAGRATFLIKVNRNLMI